MYEYVYEYGILRNRLMESLFDHDNLRVYQEAIAFVAWLDTIEATVARNMVARDHLKRASTSIPVNIAEASGKRATGERRQFIDTAYGSSLECAACLDIIRILQGLSPEIVAEGKSQLSTLVSMLVGFRKSTERLVRERGAAYGTEERHGPTWFDHEKLDVYVKSLSFVAWIGRLCQDPQVARSTISLLDKAATGVVLNIAEGNGKYSAKDRCRFIGHSRTAALQAAAWLDVLVARRPTLQDSVMCGKRLLVDVVRMLVAWEKSVLDS